MTVNSKKKSIIISETLLTELLTKKNLRGEYSSYSSVYLGNNWVKKLSKDGKYPESELAQYKLMSEHPDFFPTTIIRNTKSGLVILQKKLNIAMAKRIWEDVQYEYNMFNQYTYYNFRSFLEDLAERGANNTIKNIQKVMLQNMNTNALKRFNEYFELSLHLYELRKKNPDVYKYEVDLHDGNYGVDHNGNIKIIDFIVD